MRNSHQISREATSMLVMGFNLRASASLPIWYCCFLFFATLSPWSSDAEAEISAVYPSEGCVMALLWTCTTAPAQSGTAAHKIGRFETLPFMRARANSCSVEDL